MSSAASNQRLGAALDGVSAALAEVQAAGTDAARAAGGEPPANGHGTGFRCSTLDGQPIDPAETVAHALIGHVRRVVIGADSVIIDLGRRRRCFTGPSALAVQLANTTCFWPGCDVPVTDCQIDHTDRFNGPNQGRTSPGNGGPACGKHNRLKEQGFTVWRDPAGRWHVYRPDGTEIL